MFKKDILYRKEKRKYRKRIIFNGNKMSKNNVIMGQ